ncbi:hypothetical protein HMPREF1247_0884 [Atopobium sp. BV3Ac4]|nr:hypothetical protein HMPREF1247_0884 [Atopobium sp. BV3Ac4]
MRGFDTLHRSLTQNVFDAVSEILLIVKGFKPMTQLTQ